MLVVGEGDPGGTPGMSPQQLAEAVRDVEVTIGEIRALARDTLPRLEGDVTQQRSQFSGAARESAIFGGTSEAQRFSTQLGAAHDVFLQTVAAILADLTSFRDRLEASLEANLSADENAEEFMRRFSGTGHEEYSMTRVQTQAVSAHYPVLER